MKKHVGKLSLVAVASFALAACGDDEAPGEDGETVDSNEELEILTGGEQGAYYPLGGALSNIINDHVEGWDSAHYSTGASVVNINDIASSSGHLGFVQNDTAYYAVEGDDEFFEEPVEGFSGMATLYPEVIQIVATAESGVESVGDLEGMSVAVGDQGSGTEVVTRQILDAHGITYDDISPEYQDFGDAADSLQDGNIDAALIVAGTPTGAIEALSAQTDIVLVDIEQDAADALMDEYPFYTEYTLEEDLYGIEEEVSTVAVQAMLIARDDLEEDVVYDIMTAIFENTDTFSNSHNAGSFIDLESAQEGMSIDLHPGAERFFDEQ
ncbi:TAXI family TRAP transporter solute-binding subunit [Shouchella shacheensis]|uniref:TAXI family TRAP transporter solute-binding subunit n=1 Tax=Shouchella shacheensis TaxID=1649580 RepID=UPI00073FE77C|nr:TAXI family TRAP transporter solute-binding subunit [Shouchella shacheensis]